MRTTLIGLALTAVAVLAQYLTLGLNGLTLLTIPLTIHLGFEVVERLTKEDVNPNE